MFAKKCLLIFSIAFLSTAVYAQKGLSRATKVALQRKTLTRAKLPAMCSKMRHVVTGRLGPVSVPSNSSFLLGIPGWERPTNSILNFGGLLKAPQVRVTELPRIVGGRHEQRKDGFYSVAKPGSGDIAAIALPAYALVKQAAIADAATMEERKVLLQWAEKMDSGFALSEEGNWNLTRDNSFQQLQHLIRQAYSQDGNLFSQGMLTALDVLEIQTWMLEHEGRFPQLQGKGIEAGLARSFEGLMKDMSGNDPEFAKDPAVQGAVQHLVHLRATARGAMTPTQVIREVLERIEKGGRIPGSSLIRVSPEENALIRELNYVEQLRRANLLYVIVPMQRQQDVLALYLANFQEQGYIYQQMIQLIPEFAPDGVTLNVPTRSADGWKTALSQWQKARTAAGLSHHPRATITGRFGLPVPFNDLAEPEKTEVLLGTYLHIQGQ